MLHVTQTTTPAADRSITAEADTEGDAFGIGAMPVGLTSDIPRETSDLGGAPVMRGAAEYSADVLSPGDAEALVFAGLN